MKKVKEFRDHSISRTCTKEYNSYSKYKKILREDFKHRCAYCNLLDEMITTYFEIDHFVPKVICKEHNQTKLISDYNNLIYSCKKCNLAKSDKFSNESEDGRLKNTKFYDPVEIPLQRIFYRNVLGGIDSNEDKGRQMIMDLKLYRLSHNYEWIVEMLQKSCEKLEFLIKKESQNQKIADELRKAHSLISMEYNKAQKIFLSSYNEI